MVAMVSMVRQVRVERPFKIRTGTGRDPGTCRSPREGAGLAIGCAMGKEATLFGP